MKDRKKVGEKSVIDCLMHCLASTMGCPRPAQKALAPIRSLDTVLIKAVIKPTMPTSVKTHAQLSCE